MEVTIMEKLDLILNEDYKHTKESAKNIFEELRNGSNDYGELKKSIKIYKKTVFFNHTRYRSFENVFIEIEKLLEKEMNSLPLTSRSK